jgi:hypothetical protein
MRGRADDVSLAEPPRVPRVLGEDRVDLAQHAPRAVRA